MSEWYHTRYGAKPILTTTPTVTLEQHSNFRVGCSRYRYRQRADHAAVAATVAAAVPQKPQAALRAGRVWICKRGGCVQWRDASAQCERAMGARGRARGRADDVWTCMPMERGGGLVCQGTVRSADANRMQKDVTRMNTCKV